MHSVLCVVLCISTEGPVEGNVPYLYQYLGSAGCWLFVVLCISTEGPEEDNVPYLYWY